MSTKIVIIGAVAGGASAAARARRLDESAEIILIERGAEPSFANCGLPYYIGGEIESREKLLVAPAERLRQALPSGREDSIGSHPDQSRHDVGFRDESDYG